MERRAVLVLIGLMMAATAVVAATTETGHSCPAANRKCEKLDNGMRCTVTIKEGGDVAALRTHVRECSAKGGPEGAAVAFAEVEGGIVVTRTSSDPTVVKALQAMADGCAGGKGCCKGDGKGEGGCPNHKKEAAPDASHKDCPNHTGDKT